MSIDTDLAVKAILEEKPRICYVGQSVYLFPNDLKPIVEAAEEVGANTMYDGAHVLGLIAGKQFQDPLGDGMNLITASTHKLSWTHSME